MNRNKQRLSSFKNKTKWLLGFYNFLIISIFVSFFWLLFDLITTTQLSLFGGEKIVLYLSNILYQSFSIYILINYFHLTKWCYKCTLALLIIQTINFSITASVFVGSFNYLTPFLIIFLTIWWLPNSVYFIKRRKLYTDD